MIKPKNRAVISLNSLCHNYSIIEKKVHSKNPACRIISVVKADAYGHGVKQCAKALLDMGCDFFAVSSAEEALELRDAVGNSPDILILGYTPEDNAPDLITNNIILTVHTLDYARDLSSVIKAAADSGKIPAKSVAKVHIKLNTGMNRIGFYSEDDESFRDIEKITSLEHLKIEGIFSHFATADEDKESEGSMARIQLDRFKHAVDRLAEMGIHPATKHICNSAGILHLPEGYFDAVRAGIILYGLAPDNTTLPDFRPVMRLEAAISQIHVLKKGESVSYGATYTAEEDTLVATLAIGYADGFLRAYTGCDVYSDNGVGRIVGRICMDQCVIRTGTLPSLKRGDFVKFFGHDDGTAMQNLAKRANTINYEITSAVSRRVPRVYED